MGNKQTIFSRLDEIGRLEQPNMVKIWNHYNSNKDDVMTNSELEQLVTDLVNDIKKFIPTWAKRRVQIFVSDIRCRDNRSCKLLYRKYWEEKPVSSIDRIITKISEVANEILAKMNQDNQDHKLTRDKFLDKFVHIFRGHVDP